MALVQKFQNPTGQGIQKAPNSGRRKRLGELVDQLKLDNDTNLRKLLGELDTYYSKGELTFDFDPLTKQYTVTPTSPDAEA
jgi:hypothetical protein